MVYVDSSVGIVVKKKFLYLSIDTLFEGGNVIAHGIHLSKIEAKALLDLLTVSIEQIDE